MGELNEERTLPYPARSRACPHTASRSTTPHTWYACGLTSQLAVSWPFVGLLIPIQTLALSASLPTHAPAVAFQKNTRPP